MPKLQRPDWLSNDPYVPFGEERAPRRRQPDGKIVGGVQKRSDIATDTIIGRLGIVGMTNYQAPAMVQHGFHHAVNVKESFANKAPGASHLATRDEVRNAANQYPIYPIEGNDFGEGIYSIAPESNQALWWYERRVEQFEDPSTNPFRIKRRDYGHHGTTNAIQGNGWFEPGGSQISPNSEFFLKRLRTVAGAREGVGYFNTTYTSPGGKTYRYEDLAGLNVKDYPENPYYAVNFYSKLYAILSGGRAMGKVGGLGGTGFLTYNSWSKIEGLEPPNNVTNGNEYKREIATGTVYQDTHMQADYDYVLAAHLICGMMLSDGSTTWDLPMRFSPANPNRPFKFRAEDRFVAKPGVSGEPWDNSAEGYFHEPAKWHDAVLEAADYHSQFNRTEGVPWQDLAYRFVGSEQWIEPPSDGTAVLLHAAAFDGPNSVEQSARRGRPVAFGRYKEGAADFAAVDMSRGKMYREDIIVRAAPNREFRTTVQGGVPVAHCETI